MQTRFKCPCGKILAAPPATAGRKAHCPVCSRTLRIPRGKHAPEPASTPVRAAAGREADAGPGPRAKLHDEELVNHIAAFIGERAEEDSKDAGAGESTVADGDVKGRVVVADSTPKDLESSRKMLLDRGFEVYAAEDGEKAVDLIRRHAPALALIDLKTDKMGGFQVIKAITDQFNPLNKEVWETPFFMSCPKITGRDKQYAISLGVKYYFAKPLQPGTVCAKIEKLVVRLPSGARGR